MILILLFVLNLIVIGHTTETKLTYPSGAPRSKKKQPTPKPLPDPTPTPEPLPDPKFNTLDLLTMKSSQYVRLSPSEKHRALPPWRPQLQIGMDEDGHPPTYHSPVVDEFVKILLVIDCSHSLSGEVTAEGKRELNSLKDSIGSQLEALKLEEVIAMFEHGNWKMNAGPSQSSIITGLTVIEGITNHFKIKKTKITPDHFDILKSLQKSEETDEGFRIAMTSSDSSDQLAPWLEGGFPLSSDRITLDNFLPNSLDSFLRITLDDSNRDDKGMVTQGEDVAEYLNTHDASKALLIAAHPMWFRHAIDVAKYAAHLSFDREELSTIQCGHIYMRWNKRFGMFDQIHRFPNV